MIGPEEPDSPCTEEFGFSFLHGDVWVNLAPHVPNSVETFFVLEGDGLIQADLPERVTTMRWKAILLSALLLVGPGLVLAVEPAKTYPSEEACGAAQPAPCAPLPDGTWAPAEYNTGTGGEDQAKPVDEYLAMRQRRAFQANISGTADNPLVVVDMDQVSFPDAKPYLDHEINRVRVPIRFVAEAMGAEVEWDQNTHTVTITREELVIKLVIDQVTALVNGQSIQIDAPPKLVENRTMVPLRFISEAFGAKVEWVGTDAPVPDHSEWGHYQVWIWIPWGYWGTATIEERILVHSWWWHRAEDDK
jgi:hypothetical protein